MRQKLSEITKTPLTTIELSTNGEVSQQPHQQQQQLTSGNVCLTSPATLETFSRFLSYQVERNLIASILGECVSIVHFHSNLLLVTHPLCFVRLCPCFACHRLSYPKHSSFELYAYGFLSCRSL